MHANPCKWMRHPQYTLQKMDFWLIVSKSCSIPAGCRTLTKQKNQTRLGLLHEYKKRFKNEPFWNQETSAAQNRAHGTVHTKMYGLSIHRLRQYQIIPMIYLFIPNHAQTAGSTFFCTRTIPEKPQTMLKLQGGFFCTSSCATRIAHTTRTTVLHTS